MLESCHGPGWMLLMAEQHHTQNAYDGGQMSQVGWMFTDYGGAAQRISQ